MGDCQSTPGERQTGMSHPEVIRREAQTMKLLLLGAGECGKSTILKQFRILHDNGFSESELEQVKANVYGNVLDNATAIIQAMRNFGLEYADQQKTVEADLILEFRKVYDYDSHVVFPRPVVQALDALWNDKGTQSCLERAAEFQLGDSAKYFFENLERISDANYKPNRGDILRVRARTTGIVEMKFVLNNVDFKIFDVGGQRTERRKWIHFFENVTAIIFLAAMSEYDQVLFEDEKTNRLLESIHLFETITNSMWFIKSNIILFLNKKDLFTEKIKHSPITVAFPEFQGEQTYDAGRLYIRQRFLEKNKTQGKHIYSHFTCATDTDHIKVVLNDTTDTIINANLNKSGVQ